MTMANLEKIDVKLNEMYEDRVTTIVSDNYVDKSQLLFDQMQMIAFNNKMFLNLK